VVGKVVGLVGLYKDQHVLGRDFLTGCFVNMASLDERKSVSFEYRVVVQYTSLF